MSSLPKSKLWELSETAVLASPILFIGAHFGWQTLNFFTGKAVNLDAFGINSSVVNNADMEVRGWLALIGLALAAIAIWIPVGMFLFGYLRTAQWMKSRGMQGSVLDRTEGIESERLIAQKTPGVSMVNQSHVWFMAGGVFLVAYYLAVGFEIFF